MLKNLFFILSAVALTGGCAKNQYDLQMRLLSDGKVLSAPRVIVLEGVKATVIEETTGKKTQIDVVAREVKNSLTLDVNVKTTESAGESNLVHAGNFLLNVAEDQKTEINFDKHQTAQKNFISTFEIIARKREKNDVTTAAQSALFRKLVDLK